MFCIINNKYNINHYFKKNNLQMMLNVDDHVPSSNFVIAFVNHDIVQQNIFSLPYNKNKIIIITMIVLIIIVIILMTNINNNNNNNKKILPPVFQSYLVNFLKLIK